MASLSPTRGSSAIGPEEISDSQAVMNSLRQIVHAVETGSRAAQKLVGLSGAQLLVLQILEEGGVMSINELAQKSHTHQSSVSVVASRLVEAGMVTRVAAKQDGRRLELSVTGVGRRALQGGFITPQQRMMASLERTAPNRVRELRVLLEELVASSGMGSEMPPMFFDKSKRNPVRGTSNAARDKTKLRKKNE